MTPQVLPDQHADSGTVKARWPMLISVVGMAAIIAVALASAWGVNVPSLFGPEQATLHGAVIVAFAVIGAAVIIPSLNFLFEAYRDHSAFQENLRAAEVELDETERGLAKAERSLTEAENGLRELEGREQGEGGGNAAASA